jgi:flagellar hook-basal body complex protein FliE
MITNRTDINSVLTQMRELKSQAMGNADIQPRSDVEAALRVGGESNQVSGVAKGPEFSDMFSAAINSVNETQQTSSSLATAYQQGDAGVSLSQVMVASEKASVSFQALTQVRNKIVEAYQDVMNMPI